MIRICSVNGPWQLATLVAGLRQAAKDAGQSAPPSDDYLVLYGASEPPAWVTSVQAAAAELWNWKAIVWAGDLLLQYPKGSLNPILASIRERIGLDSADQVWIWTLNGRPQKFLAESYPQSQITLFEDGLHTYVMHQPGAKSARPQDRLRLARRRWVDEWILRRRVLMHYASSHHLKRVKDVYLYLVQDLDLQPPYSQLPCRLISDDIMREVLVDMAGAFGVVIEDDGRVGGERRALVLGQCFAKVRAMSEAQELTLYQKIVGKLLEDNYTVYWKDHPRVEGLYYERLRETFPDADLRKVNLPPGTPIELAAGTLGLTCCVAATSSSLFYLPRLYKVESYTMAQEILALVDGDLALMTQLTIRKIPGIDQFLQAN